MRTATVLKSVWPYVDVPGSCPRIFFLNEMSEPFLPFNIVLDILLSSDLCEIPEALLAFEVERVEGRSDVRWETRGVSSSCLGWVRLGERAEAK